MKKNFGNSGIDVLSNNFDIPKNTEIGFLKGTWWGSSHFFKEKGYSHSSLTKSEI